MNFAQQHDIGAWLGNAPGIASTAQTAGSTAAINGKAFDRLAQSDSFHSVMIVGQLQSTLASGNTASVALKLQDSPNDSDWTDYGDGLAATVTHNAAGGAISNVPNTIALGVDLTTAERYIRMVLTPSMSATGTDTCVATGVMILGGAEAIPVANPIAI